MKHPKIHVQFKLDFKTRLVKSKKKKPLGKSFWKKRSCQDIGKKLICLISHALKEFHVQGNLCFGTPPFSPGEVLGFLLQGMCRWPLRAPIDPILVTFGQICNFRHPNLVTFNFCIYPIDINPWNRSSLNELTHWPKNTFFTYNTNILVSLITVNMKNCLTPKIRKCATQF